MLLWIRLFVLLFMSVNCLYAQDNYYDENYYYDDEYYDDEEGNYDEYSDEEVVDVEEIPSASITDEIVTNISIPILQDYQPPNIVDPINLSLPANHRLVRARGTVWRSSETFLKTNRHGVISEQRMFIFFDRDRDAISYQYSVAQDRRTPMWPEKSSFVPLFPLLETNDFVPIPAAKVNVENNTRNSNIQYTINPSLMRNYDYEESLNKIIKNNQGKSKDYQTVHTNITVVTNSIERPFVIVTNQKITVTTNISLANSEVINGDSMVSVPMDTSITENILLETTNEPESFIIPKISSAPPLPSMDRNEYNNEFSEYNYDENIDSYDDEIYNGSEENINNLYDTYSKATYMSQQMVAQEITITPSLTNSQYIINLGGGTGGIFIHETGDINQPYRVVFLSMEQGLTLYEYNIGSSFDVRDGSLNSSQQARELYIRILNERINMKKYDRVRLNTTFLDSY